MQYKSLISVAVLLFLLLLVSPLVAGESDNSAERQIPIQVNDIKITMPEYQAILRTETRNRFYHLKIPEQEQKTFPMEVADKVVLQYLMIQDLKNHDIAVDMEWVTKQQQLQLEKMDRQYKDNKNWQTARDQYAKDLLGKLKQKFQLNTLTQKIKTVPKPDQKDVMAYYQANPDQFMAPVQQRVSVIILSVPPSSSNEVWDSARAKAKEIIEQLNKDKPFEVMAEIYSSDISAEMGGDMGFIHDGMLGKAAQKVIDKLKVGEVSQPVTLLEGIALLKLTERTPAKLNTFERVEAQATRIVQQQRSDQAWNDYITALKNNAKIIVRKDLLNQAM